MTSTNETTVDACGVNGREIQKDSVSGAYGAGGVTATEGGNWWDTLTIDPVHVTAFEAVGADDLSDYNLDGIVHAAHDAGIDPHRLSPHDPIKQCVDEHAARIARAAHVAEARAVAQVAEEERKRRLSPEARAAENERIRERGTLDQLHKLRMAHDAKIRFQKELAAADPAPPFDDGLLGEILARPPEPPERIADILPWDSSLLVIAQRKAGKTTLILNIIRSLLNGTPFLGRFATIPVTGRVAFMNYEVNGAQIGRWADEAGIDHSRLYVVNLRGRRNPLAVPEDRAELAQRMRVHGVESVIVDPFGRAYTGTSQNDAGEVTAFLVDLDKFVRQEVGARDLVLAVHAGWDGERARGSSALEDWGDAMAYLTVDDRDQRYFRSKGRLDTEVDEDMLTFDAATRTLALAGTGGRKAQRTVIKVHELEEPITTIIGNSPEISVGKIREALRKSKVPFQDADVTIALEALAARGRITRIQGGPGKATTHRLRNDTGESNPFGNPGPASQPFATPSHL
ncbi:MULTISPECIES: ATP-binding protein [Rhodococcus]|uniref:ATP-binding protein n=1 Tax=Rhodococcus TaxID=1827 RepID=UPI0018DAD789|nr:AAA family ATPase [Rhodococcus qingshengii]QPG87588.1 AAA family ATPase [Rhodococcus qingshengii]